MAHHVYQTEGIVLSSLPEGEASKYLRIFTRELGLVGGTARSVREGRSKLRYALQDYSLAKVSIVRGKDVWRIVNAVPVTNYHSALADSKGRLHAATRILALMRKLVVGEGAHPELYDRLIGALDFLVAEKLSRDEIVSFQLIAALRILHALGYGAGSGGLDPFASGDRWSREYLAEFGPLSAEARAAIRRALSATDL